MVIDDTRELGDAPRPDDIADFILDEIMTGALRFGQKISENTYASRLGVSRTPVREAIVTLRYLGLIIVRPRSGSYVVSFTRKSLSELFSVRHILEGGGVRGATRQQRTDLVETLTECQDDLERWHDPGAVDPAARFRTSDTRFHGALARASENPLMMQMYRPVEVCSEAVRSRFGPPVEYAREANAQHQEMIDAIADGDIRRFDRVLKEHLMFSLDMLMQVDELFDT